MNRPRPFARLFVTALAIQSVVGAPSAATQTAQRLPVLQQVRVPHNYYWREMYVPQVTSGPRSPSWSPDGAELVYSMAGSLWRQRIDSNVAVQLTDGPGYHYQPDWSPDGRYIAFAAYDGEQIELRVLEVDTGEISVLLSNGGVNLEPRFSPNGQRLAWVTTAHEGRWHVAAAGFSNGSLGMALRLSEDRDSHLPRYYYSVWDHAISPTWSPDGSEIMYVSNRGRIWGTGGFWRQESKPNVEPREIRYEETTWKAKPDWSSDGKRVVYASYLGRQRHQLWLMTAEGGDVFPLTYGDYDATEPRWSPDTRRIAFVANEHGDTELRVIELPGGATSIIAASERRTLRPHGQLRIEVTEETGGTLPARVSVTGADGRGWAPADALRHADDSFDRTRRTFEPTYFHAAGVASLSVPAGDYTVEVLRGPEYGIRRAQVSVGTDATETYAVQLRRIADPQQDGWYSGDLHVHMNYGGAYRVTPEKLVFQAAAEDLDVVQNTVVNKEQRVPDIDAFRTDLDPASTASNLLFHGQEFHTSVWGHMVLLGLRSHLLLPDYAGYVNTAVASLFPHNAAIGELAHEQAAISGYVHPFDTVPDPADRSVRLTSELPVDAALATSDYFEVVGFSDHLNTSEVWYRLLNCGFPLAAGAGTDAMTNYASLRGPVGQNRTYVRIEGALAQGSFLDGIRAGRTIATNGPLLQLRVNDAQIGDTVALPAGAHELRVTGSMRSAVRLDHVQVVANGQIVAEVPMAEDGMSAEVDVTVPVDRSGWVTLRAYSNEPRHPVFDVYPYGTTSPVWIEVEGAPANACNADYFLAWIDRLEETANGHEDWNDRSERAAVLESFEAARAVYRERAPRR